MTYGRQFTMEKQTSFRLPKIPSLNIKRVKDSTSKQKEWTKKQSASERHVIRTQVALNLPLTPPTSPITSSFSSPVSPRATCGCRTTDLHLTHIREHVRNFDMDINEFCAFLDATEPYIPNMRMRLRDFCVERARRYATAWALKLAEQRVTISPDNKDQIHVPMESEFYRQTIAWTTLGDNIIEIPGSPRVTIRVGIDNARKALEDTTRQRFRLMLTHLTTAKNAALINMQCCMPEVKDNMRFLKEQNDETYLDDLWEQFYDIIQEENFVAVTVRITPPTLRNFENTADIITELKHLMLLGSSDFDVIVVKNEEKKALENIRIHGNPFENLPPPLETRQPFGILPCPKPILPN